MQRADVLALTSPIPCDPTIAIAASRAGAHGVLDLEYTPDRSQMLAAIERLEHHARGQYGIKVSARGAELLDALADNPPRGLTLIVLAGGEHPQLARQVARWKRQNIEVLFEAINEAEMLAGAASGADGLILKGNEAGGRIGPFPAFIFLQKWHQLCQSGKLESIPVWVQGGIGPNTAAACMVAGARGIVLADQLQLARESSLDPLARGRLAAFDGSQTIVLGEDLGAGHRLFQSPRSADVEALTNEARRLAGDSNLSAADRVQAWKSAVLERIQKHGGPKGAWLLGQDAALAQPLAERFVTVGGIIGGIIEQVEHNLAAARRLEPLAAGSPMAESHGTKYPILQGPMTRVSDTAPFAAAVAEAGGLPFLALALLRGNETKTLLAETRKRIGDRPWGVGLLGFLPPEIRQEQLSAILADPPPVALIAGGRPDQAKQLEDVGIPTYLHVPSPGLLQMFIRDGAKRFIFEGRECGGHVGPRTSFVLWETMCGVLLEHLGTNARGAEELHIVFAGGIHDALSGAMVAALSAPLAERGVRIGVLMGTAYLYTNEAVTAGAIVKRFQKEALDCHDTVLLETGPGHAIRCVKTPYCDDFAVEKRRLEQQGKPPEEITRTLEWMNVGRLRVASKGVDRVTDAGGSPRIASISEEEQYTRGMYMIGQVSLLRDRTLTMADLHAEVCEGATRRLADTLRQTLVMESKEPLGVEPPCDVAIIGMSCFYPGAKDLRSYWRNILEKVYAVTEVPASHWDWELYYDSDPLAKDRIVSKWGGFLGDQAFDPFTYGITPASMKVIEPLQLLLLEAVRQALGDAGYSGRPFPRERTAAICGIGGGGSPMATAYGFRTCMPLIDLLPDSPFSSREVLDRCQPLLPEWTEDSFPGFLMNVAVGRVANRFNLGGPNFAIDAACASSLAALHAAVRELQVGTSDVALAMGADTVQTPFAYMAFSKTFALSKRGRCSPFDAAADGIVLSEGIGVVVLKRLADAERDGDRIFAVIKGIGSSSDGKDKGLTAPNATGQGRALARAYAQARIKPSRVKLVEAHGTGTVVGDRTEAESLGRFLTEAGAEPDSCAVGSVKSMIGHSKCAAGTAGLIKTTMAVYHKILPPTLVETPNPKAGFGSGPLYLNTESRPWIHGGSEPRVAGVSAFGFGGTNYHVVLEEYQGDYLDSTPSGLDHWPAELIAWRRPTRAGLIEAVQQCQQALMRGAQPLLSELAASVWKSNAADASQPALAIVAASLEELREKLLAALEVLRSNDATRIDPRGIYFAEKPRAESRPIAFLFPGQGSQYVNMFSQLAMAFISVRKILDRADGTLQGRLDRSLASYLYPASSFSEEEKKRTETDLARSDVAQAALGATGIAMFDLLRGLGVTPDFLAGHSYGEYVALAAAGSLAEDDLIRISHRRGELIRDAAQGEPGGMAAVAADAETVGKCLAGLEGITLANRNSPKQTVISGTEPVLVSALERCEKAGLRARRIPVSCAFHSPHVGNAARALASELSNVPFQPATLPVFSNTTAGAYPADADRMAALLAEHLTAPVRFQEEIEALYQAGARIFVEVGPQGVLTGLVHQILEGRQYVAVASDLKDRPGLVQLAHLLGQLVIRGAALKLDELFEPRRVRTFDLSELARQTGKPNYSASTWLVNGVRCRPINAPEPMLLGQRQPGSARSNGKLAESKPQTKTTIPSDQTPAARPREVSPQAHTNGEAAARPMVHQDSNLGATMSAALNHSQHATPGAPAPRTAQTPAAETNGNGKGWHPLSQPAASDETVQVMMRYQDLMARFLEAQRSVMLTFLEGSAPAATMGDLTQRLPAQAAHANHVMPVNHVIAQPAYTAPVQPSEGPVQAVTVPAAEAPEIKEAVETAERVSGATAAPAAKNDELPSIDELRSRLLELVSKRTGYPKEMLDENLDLEADLGIDSIKRVEILGTLAESLGGTEGDLGQSIELEKLTGIRTLRGILEYLDKILNGQAEPAAKAPAAKSPASSDDAKAKPAAMSAQGELDVQRALVELIEAPLPGGMSPLIPQGAVLITDDGDGIAQELAGRFVDFGQQVVIVRQGEERLQGQGGYSCDLTNPEQVERLIAQVRKDAGAIGGVVHLLPLSAGNMNGNLAARASRDVKSLYLLARMLGEELCQAGENGGAFFLAPTWMGGSLGFGDEPLEEHVSAAHGGILGFTKCLAQEWDQVLVRAIDLSRNLPPTEVADCLLAELSDREGPSEVGYSTQGRVTWQLVQSPLTVSEQNGKLLDSNSTVLITGGGRGITSAVAQALAERYRPRLILVGRSPLPAEEEPADVASLSEPAEIKQAIIRRFEKEGRQVAPAAIEAEFQRLMRDREIRETMSRLRDAGATTEYHSVDVRDTDAFGRLIDDLTARFGGLDGVIHGAGVIEDKLIRDKTPASFDRVFHTKVDSAHLLASRLDPQRLKFCVFFSSLASRYGNRGQADYAAANEVLSKLAGDLDRRWPGRVVAVAWGPWSGLGMVADLEVHLTRRGLKLISPEEGPRFLIDELIGGRKGQFEVVIAGGAERLVQPKTQLAAVGQ